jgi:hypothetical protein
MVICLPPAVAALRKSYMFGFSGVITPENPNISPARRGNFRDNSKMPPTGLDNSKMPPAGRDAWRACCNP